MASDSGNAVSLFSGRLIVDLESEIGQSGFGYGTSKYCSRDHNIISSLRCFDGFERNGSKDQLQNNANIMSDKKQDTATLVETNTSDKNQDVTTQVETKRFRPYGEDCDWPSEAPWYGRVPFPRDPSIVYAGEWPFVSTMGLDTTTGVAALLMQPLYQPRRQPLVCNPSTDCSGAHVVICETI